MPNPLLTHHTARRVAAETTLTGAAAALEAARSALAAARTTFDGRTADVAGLEADIAAKREELRTTSVPAEAQALLDQITADVIALRALGRALATARLDLASKTAAFEAALAKHEEARADVEATKRAETAAQNDDQTWGGWVAALDLAPLQTLKADATAALAAAPYTGAKARVDALPQPLRDLASSRFGVVAARAAQARTAADDVTTERLAAGASLDGQDGAVAKVRGALERAAARLRDHVQLAPERFTAAQARLTQLGAAPLLSTAAQQQISAAGDLRTNGEAAAAKEVAFNTAQKTVDEKRTALDKRKRAVLADDPGANVSNLNPEQGELNTAVTALNQALADLQPLAVDLPPWLVIAPDDAWADLLAFYDAEQTLTELGSLDAKATLVQGAQGLTQLQTDLAAALDTAFKARRKHTYLGHELEQRGAERAASEAGRAEDALTALRQGV